MNNASSNISRILATSLLLFLFLGILQGLYSYDETKQKEEKHIESVREIRELQWQTIESIIIDNYNNAETFAGGIRSNIEVKILSSYQDKNKLQYDLENPNSNAQIYNILASEITGKYLNNIHNDNNDPFVASREGVLSDLSLNCSPEDTTFRTWDQEVAMHTNKSLANKAINSILLQSNKPIFWEFRKSNRLSHITIVEMDLKELKSVFMQEGLDGLETYEFLKPVYIQQHGDIFGAPDVNNIGIRYPNSKIIIIAGFNINDILSKYHKTTMSKYDTLIDRMNEYHKLMQHRFNVINTVICVVLLFCIVFTAIINNYVVSVIRRKDCELKNR